MNIRRNVKNVVKLSSLTLLAKGIGSEEFHWRRFEEDAVVGGSGRPPWDLEMVVDFSAGNAGNELKGERPGVRSLPNGWLSLVTKRRSTIRPEGANSSYKYE